MDKIKSALCEVCQEQRRFTKKTPTHSLHIVLTILTGGLWLIPYFIIVWTGQQDYTCATCGTKFKAEWMRKLGTWGDRKRAESNARPGWRELWREGVEQGLAKEAEKKAKRDARERSREVS